MIVPVSPRTRIRAAVSRLPVEYAGPAESGPSCAVLPARAVSMATSARREWTIPGHDASRRHIVRDQFA